MERPAAKGIKNPTARPFSPTNSKPWNGPRANSPSTSDAWEARSIVEAIDSRGRGSAIHQPIAKPASIHQPIAKPASIHQPIAEPASFGSPLAEKSRRKMPDIGRWTIPTPPPQAPTRAGDPPSQALRIVPQCRVKHPVWGGLGNSQAEIGRSEKERSGQKQRILPAPAGCADSAKGVSIWCRIS
jgi:hypothetical protein